MIWESGGNEEVEIVVSVVSLRSCPRYFLVALKEEKKKKVTELRDKEENEVQ